VVTGRCFTIFSISPRREIGGHRRPGLLRYKENTEIGSPEGKEAGWVCDRGRYVTPRFTVVAKKKKSHKNAVRKRQENLQCS
jgi:hypothetical protein